MRILIVNSNTSERVTDLLAREARAVAASGTEIVAVGAAFGCAAIETSADLAIAAPATLDALFRHGAGADAGVIACFGDPGLLAAREQMPFPVVGMAEAAVLSACMLGERFSIVTAGHALVPAIRDSLAAYGVAARMAGIHVLSTPLAALADDREGAAAQARALCRRAVEDDGAEVIVLGGAFLAGIARLVADSLAVPVLGGIAPAVKQAETLAVLCGVRDASRRGTGASAKSASGAGPATDGQGPDARRCKRKSKSA